MESTFAHGYDPNYIIYVKGSSKIFNDTFKYVIESSLKKYNSVKRKKSGISSPNYYCKIRGTFLFV